MKIPKNPLKLTGPFPLAMLSGYSACGKRPNGGFLLGLNLLSQPTFNAKKRWLPLRTLHSNHIKAESRNEDYYFKRVEEERAQAEREASEKEAEKERVQDRLCMRTPMYERLCMDAEGSKLGSGPGVERDCAREVAHGEPPGLGRSLCCRPNEEATAHHHL